jgi:hypothetical protein
MAVVKLDLSSPEAVSTLLDPIEQGMIEILTSAPPCGTASRAREIPMEGRYSPKPLRSELYPRGLPDLSPEDQSRVDKANAVYDSIILLVLAMLQQGKSVLIENPLRSLLWELPTYKMLLELGCFDVVLQNCKFSVGLPSRAKWSRFRTNIEEFRQLAGKCNLDHVHLPWGLKSDGSFATADEAAYPLALCFHMASVLVQHLRSRGFQSFSLNDYPSVEANDFHKKRRLLGFQQPRGNRLYALVSEFKDIITLAHNSPIGKDQKLLRHTSKGGDNLDEDQFLCPVVGVFRTPLEFVEESLKVVHPIDMFECSDRHIFNSIIATLEEEPAATAKLRLMAIKELAKLAQDLKTENDQIFNSFDPGMKSVYKGKNFALLLHLLKKYKNEWPDTSIGKEMIEGAKLTGMHEHTGIFPFEMSLPTITEEHLRSNSELRNQSMLTRTKSSGDSDLDEQLWSQTLDENKNGWLDGPFYSIDHLSDHLKDVPHVSRRFPISQSNKVRAIDDFHESNINLACGLCDKLQLMDVDTIAASIRLIEHIVNHEPKEIRHPDGGVHKLNINHEWLVEDRLSQWQGAALDLKAAYKQIAIASKQRWANVVCVYDPTSKRPALFVQNTLPFGAMSSVMFFNRIARFLWFVGCREYRAIWHNFYDDYPTLSPTILSKSTKLTLELFMKILGWNIACDEKKQMSFSELFSALGVVFDVSDLSGLGSFISNTEKRKTQVIETMMKVVETKSLTQKQAESLVGKLQFMEAQCFGRIGRSYLRCVRKFVSHNSKVLESDCKNFLDLATWLETCEPRRLTPARQGTNVVFTDGACEFVHGHRKVTCGALLFPADKSKPLCFGFEVPNRISDEWAYEADKEQLVTEAELFPAVIALKVWNHHFANRRALFFVDSEPAKNSLVRGTSNAETCAKIVREFYQLVDESKVYPWFTRVPSFSNPADAPSRLDLQECVDLFGAEVINVSHLLH